MAKTNSELSTKLADQGAVMTPDAFKANVGAWFKQNIKQMAAFAGSKEEAKKYVVALMHVVKTNPKVMECSMDSVGQCLMTSAALNLFPGPYQECAYVPFNSSKTGRKELTFIPQYQGIAKLSYFGGSIKAVYADVVYSNDYFDFAKGSDVYITHRPEFKGSRGEWGCVYGVVKTTNGGTIVEVKGKDWVEGIKARAPGAKMSDSPWNSRIASDYDEMAKKSIIKLILKTIPKSPQLAMVIDIDNAQETGKEMPSVIDVEFDVD